MHNAIDHVILTPNCIVWMLHNSIATVNGNFMLMVLALTLRC